MEYNLGSVVTNATARRAIYGAYVVAGLFFGASSAAFAVLGTVSPDWVNIGLAVLGYLAIPVGGLALVNVGTTVTEVEEELTEEDFETPDEEETIF